METLLPLGPYDPADPVVLEVLMEDRDAVWKLQEGSLDESKHRPLGLWSSALASSVDNYSFEKQLLTYCCA